MDKEHSLLFGLLAVKTELIAPAQIAEAFRAWTEQPDTPFDDLLQERGLLPFEKKKQVEELMSQQLAQHGGDVRATLHAVEAEISQSSTSLDAASWSATFAGLDLPPPENIELPPSLRKTDEASTASTTGDRYHRLHLHASGGIGQVWVARDQHLQRDVALKELRPESRHYADVRKRFVEEARVTGQLEHPGIVPVYELAEAPAGTEPYYVMRFVKGRTLSSDIQAYHSLRRNGKAGSLEQNALLQAFMNVCQAVAYAHARGVIHRDLKGANVILGDFGEVMVLDWGLAKKVGGEDISASPLPPSGDGSGDLTLKGQVLGTPAYMAPEQASGELDRMDQRTDVYGLGAILYEILTGRPPFSFSVTVAGHETRQALDMHEMLRRIREENPSRPRALNPRIAPALEAVCLRALAKDPAQRYSSAGDLAREIQRWLADEPVEAYREPLRAKLGRWGRRHKALVRSAAAGLVLLVAGLTVSTILISQEQARTEEMAIKADENFRAARDVVDRFFVKVSKERLLNEPGLQPLRRELLQMAGAYYDKFARSHANDPAVKADLARTLYHLAQITSDLGDYAKADTIAADALRLFEELALGKTGAYEFRSYAAKCYNRRGVSNYLQGKPDRAEPFFREAADRLAALAQLLPSDTDVLEKLAFVQGNLGHIYQTQGKKKEALDAFQQALATHEALAKLNPENPVWQDDLAADHSNIAQFFAQAAGQPELAEQPARKALEIHRALAAKHPTVIEYQRGLAKSLFNIARLYGPLPKAGPLLNEALEIRRRIARGSPKVTAYQNELAEGLITVAQFHETSRKHSGPDAEASKKGLASADDAVAEARAILEGLVREYPDRPAFAENLGRALSLQGDFRLATDPQGARKLYDDAVRRLEDLLSAGHAGRTARLALRNAYWGLAEIDASTAKPAVISRYWHRALELDDGARRNVFQAKLAALAFQLARQGNTERAAREADALARTPSLPGKVLWNLALTYERCAQAAFLADKQPAAEKYAASAVAMLSRAVDAHVLQRELLRQHLDALAGIPLFGTRPEFQQLLKKVK